MSAAAASPKTRSEALVEAEFVLSRRNFENIAGLLRTESGIHLPESKAMLVYSRLAKRLRQTGCPDFDAYWELIDSPAGAQERQAMFAALTTNVTRFFREPHHFDHLKKTVLPELVATARAGGRVRLWSSACSTGEEPYSIAITILETFGSQVSHVSIFASDLDTNVLETARKGVYPVERVEKMDPERLRRFFLRGTGSQEGMVAVRPELKRLIEFQRINLLEPNWPVRGPLDVIFCRNVMIYFDKPTQYKILSRFEPMIEADGLMFAGHSESFLHAADLFRSLGKTVYVPTRGQRGR